jgi:two-component system, OmpR family, phosphate regulon sensor histidine kinase PhoR
VQAKIFWKLGLTYVALLLAVLLAVGFYAERMLRSENLRAAEERLALASLVILALGIASMLLYARAFSARVERLKGFTRRVGEGDFRPLPSERRRDELSELAEALNETAARLDGVIRTLTEERNRSAAILRSMVEGVAVIDAKERMVFCNEAFMEILGPDAASGEGGTLLEVTRQPELIGVIRRALESGEVASSEVAVGTVAPRTFSATAAPVPVRPEAGDGPGAVSAAHPQAAVVVLHDITELRRLERARRDFVANVSHEFKTPLTAIQGFAETLLGGALDDRENNRRFLEVIREHAVRLARLTDDMLKLSRIEAGKFDLEFRPLRLAEVIGPCLETAGFKTAQKGLSLEADIPGDLPLVRGDLSSLSELLQNLLDNAVQYTPRGGRIRVSARVAGEQAVLTVSDTGIGIPQAEQERIFERFYRVDAARSREAGGTGLGLAIAKHIVESHGGRIWVESAVGQGSQFHFSIPLASQA